MKNSTLILVGSGPLLALAGMLAPASAEAAPSPRAFRANPTAICQGALPAFETAIRKRPLAIQNEGTSSAFITCSFISQGSPVSSTTNPTAVQVFFNNVSGVETTISCTGVSGYATGANQYLVKSVDTPASGSQGQITWTAGDFAGAPAQFPSGIFSISCSLPPGGAINDSAVLFQEEIGT